MADVTINDLSSQAPTSNDVFPFSTTGVGPATYKASLAQIKTALAISWADVSGKPSFATVATTGSYNDLTNKPTTGKVLQIQTGVKSDTWIQDPPTNSWLDIPGFSATITTTGINNKVLVQANINGCTREYHSGLRLVRNNTTFLGLGAATGSRTAATCGGFFNNNYDAVVTSSILFVDTPGAIGTYTYKVQIICPQNTTIAINTSTNNGNYNFTMVTGASVITLTEIAA